MPEKSSCMGSLGKVTYYWDFGCEALASQSATIFVKLIY